METRANFLLIGLFVAVNIALALRFALFIESAAWTADRVYYELAFSNVRANIGPGAPVNFNGVKVGEIVEAPVRRDATLAVMLAQIDRSAPIRTNTKAKVELSNLIGSAMISLEGVAGDAPALEALPGQSYPRIVVENSLAPHFNFEEFNARLAKLSENARETLDTIPSELSTIRWQLDSVVDVMRPFLRRQSGAGLIDVEAIERSTDKLESMIVASQRFVKANNLAAFEKKSQDAKARSATDLDGLKRLAIELRKKVNIFEQKIRDTGLTQAGP